MDRADGQPEVVGEDFTNNVAPKGTIAGQVELRLRHHGIKLYDKEEWIKDPVHPCITIDVDCGIQEYIMACSLSIEVSQATYTRRNPEVVIPSITDKRTSFLMLHKDVMGDRMRREIERQIDQIANDFLKWNPKTAPKE